MYTAIVLSLTVLSTPIANVTERFNFTDLSQYCVCSTWIAFPLFPTEVHALRLCDILLVSDLLTCHVASSR